MQSCRMFLFVKQNTDINYFSLNTCENITNITWIPFLGSVLRFLSSFQCFLAIISFKPLPLFSCPFSHTNNVCIRKQHGSQCFTCVYWLALCILGRVYIDASICYFRIFNEAFTVERCKFFLNWFIVNSYYCFPSVN